MNPNMMATLGIAKKRPPMGGIPSFKPRVPMPGGFPMRRAAAGDTADPAGGTGELDTGHDDKISPEEVEYSAQDNCGTCANMGGDGNCTKYSFPVEETGHCAGGYEPQDASVSSSDLGTTPPAGGAYGTTP